MAQYVRLAHALDAGEPVETPAFTRERYLDGGPPAPPALSVAFPDGVVHESSLVLGGQTDADTVLVDVGGSTRRVPVEGGRAMVWEGADATRQVRRMMGETDPAEAQPGTVRGDLGLDLGQNVIHGSDHEDEGANEREISLFFDDEELVDWDRSTEGWVYEDAEF
jgi:hypothetical protein